MNLLYCAISVPFDFIIKYMNEGKQELIKIMKEYSLQKYSKSSNIENLKVSKIFRCYFDVHFLLEEIEYEEYYIFVIIMQPSFSHQRNPRYMTYTSDKIIIQDLCHGKYVNEDSFVNFNNGFLHGETYIDQLGSFNYFNGLLHNSTGSAIILSASYTSDYYSYGQLHNTNGPAMLTEASFDFYINGIELSKEEFEKQLLYQDIIRAIKY